MLVWHAVRTVEWGNRLHRAGAFWAAAAVYRANLQQDGGQEVAYNLGTALLQAGSDEAEGYLERASAGPDPSIAQRAHYNVGYRLLEAAEGSTDPVSGVGLVLAAIRNNRAALRLDPADGAARWNLALAERMYESFPQLFEEGPAEQTGGEAGTPPETDDASGMAPGTGSGTDEEGSPPEDSGDDEGGGPGAREALLGEGDPGPLSEAAAHRLLENVTDDPALLVRGVLWSQRPGSD